MRRILIILLALLALAVPSAASAVNEAGDSGGCYPHDTLYNGWDRCATQDIAPDDGWAWSSPRGIQAVITCADLHAQHLLCAGETPDKTITRAGTVRSVKEPVNEDPGVGGIPPEFSDCHGYEDMNIYWYGHRIWCSTISHVWIYMW